MSEVEKKQRQPYGTGPLALANRAIKEAEAESGRSREKAKAY